MAGELLQVGTMGGPFEIDPSNDPGHERGALRHAEEIAGFVEMRRGLHEDRFETPAAASSGDRSAGPKSR